MFMYLRACLENTGNTRLTQVAWNLTWNNLSVGLFMSQLSP